MNPQLHYTWWRISPQPYEALVVATNQFGDQTLRLFDAQYLWNPALKNEAGDPPPANHYKCYACEGNPIQVPVLLTDQFDEWRAVVTWPRWFCNPAEKTDPTGQVYPIEDPQLHYICYEFEEIDPALFTAMVTDQFIREELLNLSPSDLLCVPTEKLEVTPTQQGTWGRMKIMYR